MQILGNKGEKEEDGEIKKKSENGPSLRQRKRNERNQGNKIVVCILKG